MICGNYYYRYQSVISVIVNNNIIIRSWNLAKVIGIVVINRACLFSINMKRKYHTHMVDMYVCLLKAGFCLKC